MVLFTSSWFHWNNDTTKTKESSDDNNENDVTLTQPILLKDSDSNTRILPSSEEDNNDDNRDENNIQDKLVVRNNHYTYGSCYSTNVQCTTSNKTTDYTPLKHEQHQQQQLNLKAKKTQLLLPSNDQQQHSVLVWDRPLSILNTKHRIKSDNNVQYQSACQAQQQHQKQFKRTRNHNRCNSDELLLHQRLNSSSSSSLSSKSISYRFYNPNNISSTNTDNSFDNHDSSTTINTNDTTGSIHLKIDSIDYNLLYLCLLYTGIYFIIAIVAYSYIFESWTIIDSLYFAVATYTTVGYGDLQPTTQYGQFFTILFALYGVVILGIFLGIIGHAISNDTIHKEQQIKQQNENIILQSFRQYSSSIQSTSTTDRTAATTTTTTGTGSTANHSSFSQVEERIPVEATHHAKVDVCSIENKIQSSTSTSSFINNHFILLRIVQQVIIVQYKSIIGIMILAIILGVREKWSITSTLYFAIMSASTTGFGDYTPKTQIDKLYCIFFLPLSVAIFGDILGRIANTYIRKCHYHRTNTILQQQLFSSNNTNCDKQNSSTSDDIDNSNNKNNISNIIRTMDTNQDGKVDEQDFLLFMLIALDKCDIELIQEIKDIFHSLDRDGNGTLDKEDFVDIVVQTSNITCATNGSCTSTSKHDLGVIDEEDQTIKS